MKVRDFRQVASTFMNVTIMDWDLDTFDSKCLLLPVRAIDIPDCLLDRTIIYMQIVDSNLMCLRVVR